MEVHPPTILWQMNRIEIHQKAMEHLIDRIMMTIRATADLVRGEVIVLGIDKTILVGREMINLKIIRSGRTVEK